MFTLAMRTEYTLRRPRGSRLLEGGPGQEEALLAHVGEADDDLGGVAGADDLQHHAPAPLAVDDVVAGRMPMRSAPVVRTGRTAEGERRADSTMRSRPLVPDDPESPRSPTKARQKPDNDRPP